MASSSVLKATTSTSHVPNAYTAPSAILYYKCKDDDLLDPDSWRRLERHEGKKIPQDANIGPVIFDYDLTVVQKNKAAICKAVWKTNEYVYQRVARGVKNTDPITTCTSFFKIPYRFVDVEVYRDITKATGDDAALQQYSEKKIGQSYILHAPKVFPMDEATLKEFPVFGGEASRWELVVAEFREHTEAILIGTIRNSFGSRGIADFIGKEESGITLEPANKGAARGAAPKRPHEEVSIEARRAKVTKLELAWNNRCGTIEDVQRFLDGLREEEKELRANYLAAKRGLENEEDRERNPK